jgi:hypothetical protein
MSVYRHCRFCHTAFTDYNDFHDARNCPKKPRCGKVDNGRVCVLAKGHERRGVYCASLEGDMLVPWGGTVTKPIPRPAYILDPAVQHVVAEPIAEAPSNAMGLELVRVWVVRWSEQTNSTSLPATRCVYLTEKAAKDAREEWIRAIAAKRGVDANTSSFALDQLLCEWQIDERWALKATGLTVSIYSNCTRYFVLDDITGNMVLK